jgi:hypothetical protein
LIFSIHEIHLKKSSLSVLFSSLFSSVVACVDCFLAFSAELSRRRLLPKHLNPQKRNQLPQRFLSGPEEAMLDFRLDHFGQGVGFLCALEVALISVVFDPGVG